MTRRPISALLTAMDKVPLRVQHSLYQNETTNHVHWHINATHYLENGETRGPSTERRASFSH